MSSRNIGEDEINRLFTSPLKSSRVQEISDGLQSQLLVANESGSRLQSETVAMDGDHSDHDSDDGSEYSDNESNVGNRTFHSDPSSFWTVNYRLSLWGRFWFRFGMHFSDHGVERQFLLHRLQSDEYYESTKWFVLMFLCVFVVATTVMTSVPALSNRVLLVLCLLYASYGFTIAGSVIVQPYEGLNFAGLLPNIGVPLLKAVTVFACAIAGWVRSWRLKVTVVVCVVAMLQYSLKPTTLMVCCWLGTGGFACDADYLCCVHSCAGTQP